MSIPNFATWTSKLATLYQLVDATAGGNRTANLGGRTGSSWLDMASGVAPTTAVVPTNSTTGNMGQIDPAGTLRVARFIMSSCAVGSNLGGMLMLCDRLSHQGGLSGTTTGAQTTNLPTAALTRYTSGVGVWPCLEIYTAVGTTGTTATISYTNQAGTSGQTSQAVQFGASGFNGISQLIPVNLASGDYGCQAVASVTIALSTGTAGNFGVTLIKPLVMIPYQLFQTNMFDGDALISMLQPVQIQPGACLQWVFTQNSNTNPPYAGYIQLIED